MPVMTSIYFIPFQRLQDQDQDFADQFPMRTFFLVLLCSLMLDTRRSLVSLFIKHANPIMTLHQEII